MALRTVLVDCGSRRVPALREAVLEQGADVVTLPLARANAEVEHARPDVLVVSGGPRLFTAEPELLAAFAFLDGFAGPIFGICLGHQALAMRHGARIALGPRRRDFETVTLRGAHPLFAGYGATARFTTNHREGIDLPPGFDLLADSPSYAVEAMAHRERPWCGVQFHPETSGEAGRRLFANFFALARSDVDRRRASAT